MKKALNYVPVSMTRVTEARPPRHIWLHVRGSEILGMTRCRSSAEVLLHDGEQIVKYSAVTKQVPGRRRGKRRSR